MCLGSGEGWKEFSADGRSGGARRSRLLELRRKDGQLPDSDSGRQRRLAAAQCRLAAPAAAAAPARPWTLPLQRPHPGLGHPVTPPPCRDPTHFPTILTFLRDGRVPLPESTLERQQLRAEAAFYSLTELVSAIDDAEAARADEVVAERARQEEAAQAAHFLALRRAELLRGASEAVAGAEAVLRQLRASQEAGRGALRRVEERTRRLQVGGGRRCSSLPGRGCAAAREVTGIVPQRGGKARRMQPASVLNLSLWSAPSLEALTPTGVPGPLCRARLWRQGSPMRRHRSCRSWR